MDRVRHIAVDLERQVLSATLADGSVQEFPVSTARNGAGEIENSECTPRGRHQVIEKIGAGSPADTVFVGRQPTGEIYDANLASNHPGRDWILTRILWLDGLEPGRNRGGDRDSRGRYIYIHGTPDTTPLGEPGSRGCIRMRNSDVIALFDAVEVGTPVEIAD